VTQLLDEKQINDDSKQAYDKMLREADLDDKVMLIYCILM
jgi:hypothetical protein